jgi:hypothetical protein
MEASTFGEALKERRFVFEAYCSCYCARISLRLSNAQLAQMGKDAVNSGHMFASKETRQFAEHAAQLCLAPFTMPKYARRYSIEVPAASTHLLMALDNSPGYGGVFPGSRSTAKCL